MKKSFAVALTIVLMLVSILPGVPPTSIHTAFAYAPPPPAPPAPLPAGPDAEASPPHPPPPPGNLPLEVEEARARQAIEAVLEKYLRYWGPRYEVAPVEVTVEGEWAHGVAQWQSEFRTLDGPIHVLGHRLPGGVWQALMPSYEGLYIQWVDEMPVSLVQAGEKDRLRAQAAEADALWKAQPVHTVPPELPPTSQGEAWQPVGSAPGSVHPMPMPMAEQATEEDSTESGEPAMRSGVAARTRPPRSGRVSSPSHPQAPESDTLAQASTKSMVLPCTSLSLDGVNLSVCTSFLSLTSFVTPRPEDGIQVATVIDRRVGFREVSITAVPFGIKPSTEALPEAEHGSEEVYRKALREYREKQKGNPQIGPTAILFGKEVLGQVSVVDLHVHGAAVTQVVISEWIVEAGRRIWIVRTSCELAPEEALDSQILSFLSSLDSLELDSADLDHPSTSAAAAGKPLHESNASFGQDSGVRSVNSDLPFPSWWNGDCDTNNFYAATGVHAYPLGASHRGMKACGPRPWTGGPTVVVSFGVGTSQIEWHCPELSKRFMYLAYGIAPYSANGSEVVWNYSGSRLEKVSNGTPGRAPQPNDVLSSGPTSTFGHTCVVIGSSVDGNGNGTISVIEQNNSHDGYNTISVNNWMVGADVGGTVTGWLHDPGEGLDPPTLISPGEGDTIHNRSVHFTWQSPNSPNQTGYTFRLNTSSNPDTQPWIVDTGLGNEHTSYDHTFSSDGTFYWHMRTWNTSGQASEWASRPFYIDTTPPPSCDPNADQIALFVDAFYEGQCVVKDIGEYPNPGAIGLPNDSISSIRVGDNVQGVLCRDDGFGGACETFVDDDPDLSENPIGNDSVSSAKVEEVPPQSQWHVEYYSDDHLGNKCHDGSQDGTYVFGDWQQDAPAGGCPSDYFSARFSRSVYFPGGDYTFALGYDDGARLKVDGQTVVDGWPPSVQHYETRNLSNGYHNVEIEYFENAGAAYLSAFWWGPGYELPRESQDPSQWYAQYWGNRALWWDPVVRINEGQGFLDHQWDLGGPGHNLPNDRFSSRFERTVHFTCGRWRFNILTDDGVRFWVDGPQVLNEWRDQVGSFSPEVELTDGDHQLKVEHYENGGSAAIRVSWELVDACDTQPPTCEITSPPRYATINACPLTIQAQASDDQSGVSHVEFWASYGEESFRLGEDDTSPYSWPWDCSPISDQPVLLEISAWDNAGNTCWDFAPIILRRRPGSPSPVSPCGGVTLAPNADVTLDWNESSRASEYYAQIWGDNGTDLNSGWIGATEWHVGPLLPGNYFWEVKARNQYGESEPSDECSFIILAGSPQLEYDSQTADDDTSGESNGDGDGIVECGETIELYVTLRNAGEGSATGVNACIETSDPYVTLVDNTCSDYPDIPGGETGTNSDDFELAVHSATPGGHVAQFALTMTTSDGTTSHDSFDLSVTCPQPDLVPAQWGDWQYPIVPSSITGTTIVNTLYANYLTYIDWGVANSGDAECGGDAYGHLYLDETLLASYSFGDILPGWSWAFFDWPAIVVDTPGWHTLKVVTDESDLILESDETNNAWQGDFYWVASAPYVDDIESGVDDWAAAGLWHLMDQSTSPYPESHSWSHSWWYGQDSTGNYDIPGSPNAGSLTSYPVYIPSPDYYLRFWSWYETETHGPTWDTRWVQISVDDGSFENVLQLYGDPMQEWIPAPAVDLSPYAGTIVQFRFAFNTVDDLYNDYRGWYVDDLEISTTPPPVCSDPHEANNWTGEATSISYGDSLDAQICPRGDLDFYAFTGMTGDKVVIDIDATSIGSLLDPYIFLIDSDGEVVLAQNDDEPGSLDSKVGYHLPHDGKYYIKVRAWNHPSVGSPDHFYTIHLLTDDTNPSSAEITSPGSDAWLDPNVEIITASATDDESGINRVGFWWHDADWVNSDWVWLGADYYGADGWSWYFDTSSLPEQRGGALYIWAFDWVDNWTGAGVWNLGLDRTPPTVTAGVQQMYGDAPFRDFWVNWWDGLDNLSGIVNYDVQYRDGANGTWTDLAVATTETSTRFVGEVGHTYYFRARALDHAGNQSTYAGGDGDAEHTVEVCPATDTWLADHNPSLAQWITTDGTLRANRIHTEGEQHWVKFSATASISYTLATTNQGGHADTVLWLYDTDGSTLIDSNDDDPENWPSSRLDWRPSASGVYYAKVDHWDPWAFGCTTEYGIYILADQEPLSAGSFSISDGAAYASSPAVTLNLAGTDAGTGVTQVMASNEGDLGGATWVPYAAPLDWTLTSGDGTKIVYVKYRDPTGNESAVYSDTIVLDTTAPTGSILIEGGSEVVTDTQVALTLSASDVQGVTHMRLRNAEELWAAWEPFATSRTWALLAQEGERAVWVQFRDPAGNASVAYSDIVTYQLPYQPDHLPAVVPDH